MSVMPMLSILLATGCLLAMLFFWTRFLPVQATGTLFALTRHVAGLRRRQLSIDGLNIVYLEGGRGEPLILLHGAGGDKDNFLRVASQLRKRYRVLLPDLPGFGESDKPETISYRAGDQVQRLIAFADAVGASRFHLGGNSMGGLIAGVLAARHPARLRSLWLLAPAGVKGARPSELMKKLAAGEALPIFARNAEEMRAVIAFVTCRPPYMPGFVIEALAKQQRDNHTLNSRIVESLAEGPWLDELLLSGLKVPTLIVWGEQDRALDSSGAAVLGRLLPRAQIVLMPDIGHVPMIEAPALTVRDYLRFQRDCVKDTR